MPINFEISLQPKQREALDVSNNFPVTFYGGAKGGGKSHLIRARQVLRRLTYPHTKGLIIRKTFPELLSNHIRKFFTEYPQTREWYNKSEKAIYWPNGSVTEFSHLANTDDVYNYQGREFDDIDIDEITQHEEEVFKVIKTSNRRSDPTYDITHPDESHIKPSIFLTGNPGGPGHQWVKRIFIDRKFRDYEDPTMFAFIQAKVWDNQILMDVDPNYIKWLQDLPEHLRKAYLEGDWNVHAGMAFSELSESVHLCDPFELPPNTRYIAGYDHGFNHPYSFVLMAIIPDGQIYVIKDITGRLRRPDEIANEIILATKGIKNISIFAGHDLWSRQRDGGPKVVEQFEAAGLIPSNGFRIIKAAIDRKQGVQQLRKEIAHKGRPTGRPNLLFFRNTIEVYNNLASMQFNARDPEDVLKVDADYEGKGGDDRYDALRYGVMSRLRPNQAMEEQYPLDSGYALLQRHLEEKKATNDMDYWR